MIIKDMFKKDIDRDIKGVIKVGQKDEENIEQELSEYVVTNELVNHFRDFFEGYKKGINGFTDEMGVWISGFFGSGKSHFLKILSYILDNREVDGKKAIDFFIDDDKIKDQFIIADMKEATKISADVILFNIDSKSSGSGKDKQAILDVFLKVFNEMLGFSSEHPFIADLERRLTEEDIYSKFKNEFFNINKKKWEDEREGFFFIQDDVVQALVNINYMTKESALNWAEKAEKNYNVSIEKFAKLVNEYCEYKENNHHVIFLVDEIGQYIGDNSKLMLNLQTVTEDLGIQCGGKSWVIVTSQEAIDSMVDIKGDDFSKIQGRFKTRISLSSANVDEVIKKRILEKTDTSEESLKALYDKKEAILKNLINFTIDTSFKEKYQDSKDFANTYPFIPYQFKLLGQVLNAIRVHGAAGKHLSEGERSMLGIFQESAKNMKDDNIGVIVPFNRFYEPIEKVIDTAHSKVVTHAKSNEKLEDFDVEVLKTLFMIKYVEGIKANLENLTTLMVDNVDVDRIDLRKMIEKSLKNLEIETLISKNGEIYTFLTDDEQEINRAIDKENVEIGEIQNIVSDTIFEDIFTDHKFRYDSRYNFDFNKSVDNRVRGRNIDDIGVNVISSYYDISSFNSSEKPFSLSEDEELSLNLRAISESQKEVIIHLKDDNKFLEEIRKMLKINKYITKQNINVTEKTKDIINNKKEEATDKKRRIKKYIEESLKNANIYVNGDKLDVSEKDPVSRIEDGLKSLIKQVYSKLGYMKSKPSQEDIESILVHLDEFEEPKDRNALNDLLNFIDSNIRSHNKPDLKSIFDKFKKTPYGFIEDDIKFLIAILFSRKSIYLIKNNEQMTLKKYTSKDILRFLNTKGEWEKILVNKKQEIDKNHIKSAKEIMKDFFGVVNTADDQEELKDSFLEEVKNKKTSIKEFLSEYNIEKRFPGNESLNSTMNLLNEFERVNSTKDFYDLINNEKDKFHDIGNELNSVEEFFNGIQKNYFKEACEILDLYKNNELSIQHYLDNSSNLKDLTGEIENIVSMNSPYSNIPNLKGLTNEFNKDFNEKLDDEKNSIKNIINNNKQTVLNYLTTENLKKEFENEINSKFEDINKNLDKKIDMQGLNDYKTFAEKIKNNFIWKISNFNVPTDKITEFDKPSPKPITLNIKDILKTSTFSIKNEEDIDKIINLIKSDLKEEFKKLDEKGCINLKI
ncbi:MAG: BREX system P-loop protein BrxC [Methanobrevibacter sp.]|nr:BREX system P-loop protein BrxC [Candidatus Methanovirga meridionalis]